MIRFLSWWLFMGFVANGFSQTLQVTDRASGKPLEHVSVTSKPGASLAITDASGKADISNFGTSDTIQLELVGYQLVSISYTRLKTTGFKVEMIARNTVLNEVVVSAYKEDTTRNTSLHIESLQRKDIDEQGAFNLTDALTTIPGVSQLSTGVGISKPVIRGLYGNRILVLFSGLRFDNQQWQDEHGMGLSTIGVSGVELIKGPLSILYGTEAIGGVINILEEKAPVSGTSETDVQMLMHSNTRGGTVQVGTKANLGNKWYRVRFGLTGHSDYSDGNDTRVLNSRFNGMHAKATYGFTRNRWQSDNHYSFSYNKFGFVFNDYDHFTVSDARWSKSMNGPHHIVMLNVLSSLNRIQFSKSELSINAGLQSNLRSENEGGGELSLIMHLITGQYAAKWKKQLNKNWLMVVANNSVVEKNDNYGKRKIVPDAFTAESGLSFYLKHQKKKVIYEYGAGAGLKHIRTYLTKTVNTAGKDIDPFGQIRPFYNGMAGLSFNPYKAWNLKANLSSGVRAPNLAELSANGLHEGIYTYEIGDPDMKNEQNVNGDLDISFQKSYLQFSVSGFYNYFNNYIYLDPTNDEWFGFPIYRFRQYDARIYGSEIKLTLVPPKFKRINVSLGYSTLVGKLTSGIYLPYMPATKLTPEIRYQTSSANKWVGFCFVNSTIVSRQDQLNPQETTTPSYQLINAGIGVTRKVKRVEYVINISGKNLLNEAYYDHLSRYKNFGLLNIGRNISINLKIKAINNLKKTQNEKFN